MLGKQHISITLATLVPFLIPTLFLNNSDFFIFSAFILIATLIGSLIPDADCGGKSKLYYDLRFVYDIMIPMQKLVIWSFKIFNLKHKLDLEYEVNNEHRGIMHAPIGILISSLLLSLMTFVIIFIIQKEIAIFVALIVFIGLLIGQFLHILEDSCTVSGINWKFPFGTKELKGKIYTFGKIKGKRDIRPAVYEYLLLSISIVLLIGYIFGIIYFTLLIVYPIILLAVLLIWMFIIYTSQTDFNFWYQDIEKIRKFKKAVRNIGK